MARPATGSPRWNTKHGYWEARVSMPNSTERTPVPMPGIPKEDKARALVMARTVSDRIRAGGGVNIESTETVNEWFARWALSRDAKLRSVRCDRGRYNKWVSPLLGARPMASITRRDIELVVQHLDAAILLGPKRKGLRWKTATNVWGVVTKMFRDACRSKVLDLRVREDNPAREVEGPDRGAERVGAYLFPSEFLAVMNCIRVPVRWRRIFALSVYLYTRGGELAALDWADVSFEHGFVHVHKAIDAETHQIVPTKTKDVRKVPIEPALLPLLQEMHDAANGEGRILTSMPPQEAWAERLRKYLEWARVTRSALFADDETKRPISFHDLRHTGITWRAMRGDEPLKIMRAAGHDDLKTTQRYINEAQTFEHGFGEVFPTLPDGVFGNWAGIGILGGLATRSSHISDERWRPQRESNPR